MAARTPRKSRLDWYTMGRMPSGHPINPAVNKVLHSSQWVLILGKVAGEAKALFKHRARKRTLKMVNSARADVELLNTKGSEPGRFAGVLHVMAKYSAAVEFGQVNLAKDNPRSRGKRRVLPGSMPARYLGDHVAGGDNRRMRSVIADIERRYGGPGI